MILPPLIAYSGLQGAQESVGMRVSFIAGVLVSAVTAAAAAGASIAISSLVMPAVHELPAEDAVRAMQYAALYVVPPAFSLAVVGTGAYAATLVGLDVATRGKRASVALVIGTLVYLLGVVGVTLFGHGPLDADLLSLDSAALPVDAWIGWATAWVGFNNLRILASAVSALCFVIAMLRR